MGAPVSEDARCAGGGMLVGTGEWLPENPSERFVAAPELIGCNRLFCSACRSWVRHLDNVRFATTGAPPPADRDRLYADERAEKDRGLREGCLGFRVYLCRCACVEITGIKTAEELDHAEGWSCAGHPPRAMDDSVTPPPPSTEAEVEKMLRSTASGPPSFGDDQPWDFALRWPPPFVFQSVWPVVTRLLEDRDPTLRTRSLEFVNAWTVGDALTVARLIDIINKQAVAYPEPEMRAELAVTLAGKAISIRSYRSTIAGAIVSLLGAAPPPRGTALLLAEYEPDAVIKSASRWTESAEDHNAARSAARGIALYRRDRLLEMLAALAGRSESSRDGIMAEVANQLALPDDKLRLILDVDDIPMPQTHPTSDDCRRALGLTS